MDLKTFARRYGGHKVVYKRKAALPPDMAPPASAHQLAIITILVQKCGIPYKELSYRALGFYIHKQELTHDHAVKVIRAGNAVVLNPL